MFLQSILIGLIAGSVSKMMRSKDDGGSWLSSLLMGVIGSSLGGYLGQLVHEISSNNILLIAVAILGAWTVLYIYHKSLNRFF